MSVSVLVARVVLDAALRAGASKEFGDLAMDGLRLEARDEHGAFVIRCAMPRCAPEADRILTELVLFGMVRLARTFVSADVVPLRVEFDFPQPENDGVYAHYFGPVRHFGRSEAAIAFDPALADRPQLHQHPELYRLLGASTWCSPSHVGIRESSRRPENLDAVLPRAKPRLASTQSNA